MLNLSGLNYDKIIVDDLDFEENILRFCLLDYVEI